MVVFLLKFIFFFISTLSSLITRLIFSATAYLLVLFIQAFKVPGEAIQGALEQLADAIRSCFEYLWEILVEAIGSLISSAFDLFIQAVTESAVSSVSAVSDLAEKTRGSFDGLLKYLPEIFEGVAEFISNIAANLWKNYIDALAYVTENA
ncbi:Anti-sigma-I factor RsgI6 like [Melia azedarach]|uniref:Anti-sigma-I factor RsgI6 like n=1 Tax=Melia azedarach TaxID=155640 RepID=A0ACC1YZH1_MELAZ|nr:Anti-sigma-I factor RsgI6 like [Melia azedarach]